MYIFILSSMYSNLSKVFFSTFKIDMDTWFDLYQVKYNLAFLDLSQANIWSISAL